MNRLRIEGLLAAFPKLVGLTNKQHTYVETDTVRYVYQPLENQMYLLLITTKASNIVEDLGTLRLLAKVVPDVAGGLYEHAINDHAFELIFAFDEVLTAGGYKEEATTLMSIKTNLAMESHEEQIHLALKQKKEEEAKEHMRAEAKKIHERQVQQMRNNLVSGSGFGSTATGVMEGFGGGGRPEPGMFDFNAQQQQLQQQNAYENIYAQNQTSVVPEGPKVIAKTGMKLGRGGGGAGLGLGGKNQNLMAAMAAEDNLFAGMVKGGKPTAATAVGAFADLGQKVAAPVAPPSTPLSLVLEEKMGVSMNREGGVESCEVKGTLTLTANTDAGTMAVVQVNRNTLPSSFNFATHPKVDKKMYEQDGTLTLKGGKGFPVARPVGILRWSYNNEDAAPLTINCWPEEDGSFINVNIEMELTRKDVVLYDVNILLPLGTTEPPQVNEIDGAYKHDARNGMMCWHFDMVDSNHHPSASMEFRVPGHDTDAFFPVQIGFRSETLLCPIQIVKVVNSSTGAPMPNQIVKIFAPENYQCA
jgi:hypothetical protein